MRIWGTGTSRSFRPIWVAEELGLDYELEAIGPRTGETQTASYTSLNRKQKIPFLEDGEVKLSESLAICRYLIEAYPHEGVWGPKTFHERVKEDEWCCYIYGEIDETSLYVMRRHGDLRAIYGGSDEIVESAANYLRRHLTILEPHFHEHEHVQEGGFSVADVLLVSCLDWAQFYGVELPESIAAYRERVAQREAYQKAFAINFKDLLGA